MKKVLLGLIGLGLVFGLLFGCILNDEAPVEITTKNGVLAETGTLAEDIVITQKDTLGRVATTVTFKADGTWVYEAFTYESSDPTDDKDNDGITGEGTMVQIAGFEGIYAYDTESKQLTLGWFGNAYYEKSTGNGYGWSGDWGSTLTDPARTHAVNTMPDGTDIGTDNTEGNQPFHDNSDSMEDAYLSLTRTVYWDYTDTEVMTTTDIGGDSIAALLYIYDAYSAGAQDHHNYYVPKLYLGNGAGGTYYEKMEQYAGGSYNNYKSDSTTRKETVSIDNTARTVTFTEETYIYDTEGTVTGGSGRRAVYNWAGPEILTDDPYSDNPDDTIWTSTTGDVTAGDQNIYQFTILEQTKTADGVRSGASHSYTLTPDYTADDDEWDLQDGLVFGSAKFRGEQPGVKRETGFEGSGSADDDSFGFLTTANGLVIH